jgi:hypothetical protein
MAERVRKAIRHVGVNFESIPRSCSVASSILIEDDATGFLYFDFVLFAGGETSMVSTPIFEFQLLMSGAKSEKSHHTHIRCFE